MTDDEVFWAGVILAIPLVIFIGFELYAWARRRHARALAQRPKGRRPSGRNGA